MFSYRYKLAVLFVLVLLVSTHAIAQVRVKRGGRFMKEERTHKSRHRKTRSQQPPKEVSLEVLSIKRDKGRQELDAGFYVAWQGNDGLNYNDFQNNRNLYQKFIPARDTDLINKVYADYRIFYRRLNERIAKESAAGDTYWQERIEEWLSEKPDSLSQPPIVASLTDSGLIFSLSIDSPAASTIHLSPVVYPVRADLWFYNISAVFSKYDSWMIVKSEDILLHEQIHFDIFELHARKMRKKLQQLLEHSYTNGETDSLTNNITIAFENIYKQLDEMQLLFDQQTGAITSENGSLQQTNARWTQSLKRELEALNEFSQPIGYIRLR